MCLQPFTTASPILNTGGYASHMLGSWLPLQSVPFLAQEKSGTGTRRLSTPAACLPAFLLSASACPLNNAARLSRHHRLSLPTHKMA